LVTEGLYINYSDKELEEIKPKDQGCNETAEKIVDTSNTINGTGNINISF
jgi:serine/threonine protein phosphatase PrpC